MKKTLFAALALAFVASCSNEEVVEMAQKEAIGFDNAFINNSTRSVYDPSYASNKMFNDFKVYGFVNGNALWDEGETVTGPTTWTYTNTQYWINGADYTFHAVAPATGWTKTAATANDGVSLNFTNDGKSDVLYSTATAQGKPNGQNSTVALTFRHILSKVKFSFENAYNSASSTIKVSDIHITNAHQTGSVALNGDATTWSAHAGTLNLDFGDATTDDATTDVATAYEYGKTLESYNELLLIPGIEYTYNVTFTVHLLVSDKEIDTYSHKVDVKFTPAAGSSYDIKAIINPKNIDPENPDGQEAIQFTVNSITGWTENNVDDILKEEETTQP